MYGRQHYRGEPVEYPQIALARYRIEEIHRDAEQHRLVRAAHAGRALAEPRAEAPRRRGPRWWTALLAMGTRTA